MTTPPNYRIPKGFIYWGPGPLRHLPDASMKNDIAGAYLLDGRDGDIKRLYLDKFGGHCSSHVYALRAGSRLAILNGLVEPETEEQPTTTYEF